MSPASCRNRGWIYGATSRVPLELLRVTRLRFLLKVEVVAPGALGCLKAVTRRSWSTSLGMTGQVNLTKKVRAVLLHVFSLPLPHGGPLCYRMDRSDVEPNRRVYQGLARL